MSEAELHVLKQWLWVGQQAKARRGELRMQVPMGYVRRPSGDVVKDPDEQAQAVLGLIFEQFERQGTIGSVLRYLVHHGIKLPCRAATGAHTGELTGAGPMYRPSRMSCVIRCTREPMSMADVASMGGVNGRGDLLPAARWPPPRNGTYCCRTTIPPTFPGSSLSVTTHVQGVVAAHGEFLCNNGSIKGIGNTSSYRLNDRCLHDCGT